MKHITLVVHILGHYTVKNLLPFFHTLFDHFHLIHCVRCQPTMTMLFQTLLHDWTVTTELHTKRESESYPSFQDLPRCKGMWVTRSTESETVRNRERMCKNPARYRSQSSFSQPKTICGTIDATGEDLKNKEKVMFFLFVWSKMSNWKISLENWKWLAYRKLNWCEETWKDIHVNVYFKI